MPAAKGSARTPIGPKTLLIVVKFVCLQCPMVAYAPRLDPNKCKLKEMLTFVKIVPSLKPVSNWWKTIVTASLSSVVSSSTAVSFFPTLFFGFGFSGLSAFVLSISSVSSALCLAWSGIQGELDRNYFSNYDE